MLATLVKNYISMYDSTIYELQIIRELFLCRVTIWLLESEFEKILIS
jgi:hypothetical protein